VGSVEVEIAIALTAGVAAATIGFGATGTASAAPKNAGAACVQEGLGTLKSLGLLQAAAQKKVNYALIDSNGPGIPGLQTPSGPVDVPGGLIDKDLGNTAFLSLGAVVKLHTTNPELFAWCND
jgi:hypothetical protein